MRSKSRISQNIQEKNIAIDYTRYKIVSICQRRSARYVIKTQLAGTYRVNDGVTKSVILVMAFSLLLQIKMMNIVTGLQVYFRTITYTDLQKHTNKETIKTPTKL